MNSDLVNLAILTGCEPRHNFFVRCLKDDPDINLAIVIQEDNTKSLKARIRQTTNSKILLEHENARASSEIQFFGRENLKAPQSSTIIRKGDINRDEIVSSIQSRQVDQIFCYGSSIIKSSLLESHRNSFVNLHLGLSPHYIGSGTNIQAMLDERLDLVGATFMMMRKELDSGPIIHQVRAAVEANDTPHTIGNRLITECASIAPTIIKNLNRLRSVDVSPSKAVKCVRRDDFDEHACNKLYKLFDNGLVERYLASNNAEPLIQSQLTELLRL